MATPGISISGALLRIGGAIFLVLATFNPSGTSFVHWILAAPIAFSPGKALTALLLLVAWFLCLRTAFISLGKIGLLLGIAVFAALIWLLVDQNLLSVAGTAIVWVVLIVVGILLGLGLSWSLLRAKVTGQIESV